MIRVQRGSAWLGFGLVALLWSGLGAHSNAHASDVGVVLTNQNSYATRQAQWQQQEWMLDFEYSDGLAGGEFTLIARARWDTIADYNHQDIPESYSDASKPVWFHDNAELGLRELYWDWYDDTHSFRIGKQQVVWGKADGLKLLDVVNPQSYRQFILDEFDDSRIPLWMVNYQVLVGESGTLQLLWIPDTTAHELPSASSPFAFTSPVFVPTPPEGVSPEVASLALPDDGLFHDSDAGIRFSDFRHGWDFTLNYLYHYVDFPVVRTQVAPTLDVLVSQTLERSHLVGGSASTAIQQWTFRTEFTYETDRYFRTIQPLPGVLKSDQLSVLFGLDWQGWSDHFLSVQWFGRAILEDAHRTIEDEFNQVVTFLWDSFYYNETLKVQWLHIHSVNNGDGVVQPKISYNLQTGFDVYLGADLFYGDQDQVFGEFVEANRISLGFVWGYSF